MEGQRFEDRSPRERKLEGTNNEISTDEASYSKLAAVQIGEIHRGGVDEESHSSPGRESR